MENRELIKEYLSKFDGKYNEEDTTYGFWDVQCIMDLARADEREKMQGVESGWHNEYEVICAGQKIGNMECKSCGKKISDEDYMLKKRRNFSLRGNENDAWFLYHRECSNDRVEWLQHDKQRLSTVDVWISWDADRDGFNMWGGQAPEIPKQRYYGAAQSTYFGELSMTVVRQLGLLKGQCKKFKIVECGND